MQLGYTRLYLIDSIEFDNLEPRHLNKLGKKITIIALNEGQISLVRSGYIEIFILTDLISVLEV